MNNQSLSLDFDGLPRYQERGFVPEDADLTQKEQIEQVYARLLGLTVTSAEELEQWVMDRSELDAVCDQQGSILYIKMTCQTDNKEYADAYKKYIEEIAPVMKPLDNQLDKKYLQLLEKYPLDAGQYEVYNREIQVDVELFREENVPLQTELDLLSHEYQTICGAMTIQFEGEELTMPRAGKKLLDPDRKLRESVWKAMAERRKQDRGRLDELFNKMLRLRTQVAANAGFDNYRDYKFKAYHRFDYTPGDCKKYHAVIEQLIVPIERKVAQRRKEKMKLESIRPWDTQVDPLGRPPLKPFNEVEELIKGVGNIYHQINPDLGRQFEEMAGMGLLDLANRKGKAPGGYQNTLAEARKPFIFMNAVGTDYDVTTLLHEGGHAFHALACAANPIHDYRHAPMEFCEVASMSMELLGSEFFGEFYNDEDSQRSREGLWENVISILCWVANVDAFQQWIYENPSHTVEERQEKWVELYRRFGGETIDWEGLEDYLKFIWHRQLHIFEVPFYYIEYGIAQLGALQIWLNAQKDKSKAVADYRKGLSLGGSRPLPELFHAAGLKFDFSETTIAPLVKPLEKALQL